MAENPISSPNGAGLTPFLIDGQLPAPEQQLLDAALVGKNCLLGDGTRPGHPTPDNTIRAQFLRVLLLGGDANTIVHPRGVLLAGAWVVCPEVEDGDRALDLEGCVLPNDFVIANARIDGTILLLGASARLISLQGTQIEDLKADGMETKGDVFLRDGFRAAGTVRLLGAKIGGNLDCDGSRFNGAGVSLHCDGMETKGAVLLCNGFRAAGTVRLLGAKIGGDLACIAGRFDGADDALSCDGMETKGGVLLHNGFRAAGTVRLLGAKIGGDLVCRDGYFAGKEKAITANNATIGGHVWLDGGFLAKGKVDFANAKIGGNIDCKYGTFSDKDQALFANRATIGGNVLLGPSMMAAGTIAFTGSKIDGNLSAEGASLEGKPSLQLRDSRIAGRLTLRGMDYVRSEVDLAGASCKTLNMDGESWLGLSSVRLDNFTYAGFHNLPENCDAEFWRRWLERQPEKHLTTRFRPKPYGQLAGVLEQMGYESEARAVRVARENKLTEFMAYHEPAPPTWLGARLRGLNLIWRRLVSGPLVDYGYRPGKAALYLLVIGILGWLVYWWAGHQGIMTPTNPLIYKEAQTLADGSHSGSIDPLCGEKWMHFPERSNCPEQMPSEYSEFSSFVYAFDVLLPIVDFRQETDWAPRVSKPDGAPWPAGYWIRRFEWLLIGLGWVLSLLFVSAIGGMVRRR